MCKAGRQHRALKELLINVRRSDESQAWGSEPTLMKFMAGKGRAQEERKKHRDNTASLTFCFCEAINQASVPQRVLCERDQAG